MLPPFKLTLFRLPQEWDALKIRLLNALVMLWADRRLRTGLITLLLLAPAARYMFFLFPQKGLGPYLIDWGPIHLVNSIETNGWYYRTFYYYFRSIGDLLSPTIAMFGIFLLFPRKYYPSYLMVIPFGYFLTNLVHRMFFVNSFKSFHDGVAVSLTITLFLFGAVIFLLSDKLVFGKNDLKRVSEARIVGLINTPGLGWKEKAPIIKNEVSRIIKVDDRLYLKETG